jgi:hypothetical protein
LIAVNLSGTEEKELRPTLGAAFTKKGRSVGQQTEEPSYNLADRSQAKAVDEDHSHS